MSKLTSMAPSHLLLLKRIATADNLAGVDPQNTQLCQLHAWAAQKIRSGSFCSHVEEQELVKHVAAAASNALRQLDSLSNGTYCFSQLPPICIHNTLALFSLVMAGKKAGASGSLTSLEKFSYLQTLSAQILQTDILSVMATASTGIAAAVTRHLQTSSTTKCRHAPTEPSSTNSEGNLNSSKVGASRTSSKRLRGRLHRSQPEAAAPFLAGSAVHTQVNVTAQLGFKLLELWYKVQYCWIDSKNLDFDEAPDMYCASVSDLAQTIVPVSALAMAMLRFCSIHSSSIDCSKRYPLAHALDVLIVVSSMVSRLVQLLGDHPLQDMLLSTPVQEAILFNLAGSTYILRAQQQRQPASGAAATASSDAPAIQSRAAHKQEQQLILDTGIHDQQLLEILGLSGLISDKLDKSVLHKYYLAGWSSAGEVIASTATELLCTALILRDKQPAPWLQISTVNSSEQQISLHSVLLQLLMHLMKLTDDSTARLRLALCLILVTWAARSMYQTLDKSAAGDAVIRSILAPLILQGVPLVAHAVEHCASPEQKVTLVELWSSALIQLMMQDHLPIDAQRKVWSSIFNEDPLNAVRTAEMTVRMLGRYHEQRPAAGRTITLIINAITAQEQLLQATKRGLKPGGPPAKVLSLMVSCIKYCYLFTGMRALDLAAAIASAAVQHAEACNSSSSSNCSGNNSSMISSTFPWIHLAARALMCCGMILLRSPTTGTAEDDRDTWLNEQAAVMSAAVQRHFLEQQQGPQMLHSADLPIDQQESPGGNSAPTCSTSQPAPESQDAAETSWGSSDLSAVLQRLAGTAVWCSKQLGLLELLASSSGDDNSTCTGKQTVYMKPSNTQKLQPHFQQLQGGLNAAVQQWKEGIHQQMMQRFSHNCVLDSSWMMLYAARQIVGYELAHQLQQYAAELCVVLPTTLCCNNPSCINLSGVSELSCVGRRKCSRCQAAGYCSRECQTQHWSRHKTICKELCKSSST